MTLHGFGTSAPNEHLELWARSQYGDILRLNGSYDIPAQTLAGSFKYSKFPGCTSGGHCTPYGIMFRNAVDMGDPCMIDAHGNLLVTPAAYQPVTVAGVMQTPEEQAAAIRTRIAQLTTPSNCDGATPPHCGLTSSNLVAVLPYDPTPPPTMPWDTPPDQRLAMCKAYWQASPFAYTPNPLQLTFPIHGAVYGTLDFSTAPPLPPTNYDGFRIDSPVGLKGIQELFLTDETVDAADMAAGRADGVDPYNRGPVVLGGRPDVGGIEVVHFDLTPPVPNGLGGTAALDVDLDEDPVQF